MISREEPVATVVLEHSECARVFQKHRIDFCCRGQMSVVEAAQGRGVDVDLLVGELEDAIATRQGAAARDPRSLSTPELIAHIISTHHVMLRQALPFVQMLALKVSRVHGEHNTKLPQLERAVLDLVDALGPHLDEEEQVLFPALFSPRPDPAIVGPALTAMKEEHLDVATILERIREASDEFTLPEWACMSYRTLFAELEKIEADIFTHVHLENHVLMPRFVRVEA